MNVGHVFIDKTLMMIKPIQRKGKDMWQNGNTDDDHRTLDQNKI